MTEHTVEELEKMLAEAKAKASHLEYPKHVEPHPSHVIARLRPGAEPSISVPAFTSHHVDREGRVSVLVCDAEEEAKALAEVVKEHL